MTVKYPVIFNGDHAEFEREHADTPPKERPDWPLPSFDARDWAEVFCKVAKTQGHDIDEGWMITWFANALMRGYDQCSGSEQECRRNNALLITSLTEQVRTLTIDRDAWRLTAKAFAVSSGSEPR